MSVPLISGLRKATMLMRTISATVLITFTMMILTPVAVSAQTQAAKTVSKQGAKESSAEKQLSKTVQAIETRLQKIMERIDNAQNIQADMQQLKVLQQQLIALDAKVIANFNKIKQHLLDTQLPIEIQDRHLKAVERYQIEIAQLSDELEAVISADNNRYQKTEQAIKHLKAKRNKRLQPSVDPKQLPFQASERKARPPKKTKKELKQIVASKKPVQLAALELTAAMLAEPQISLIPEPEDVLPTEDVQITDDIRALSEQLERHPVKIYNWVRNNIEYIPSYGSLQGSQLTLDNKRGNAFDTASLLIALLRASNIPARYVYGTVQIPIEKVMDWVGGVKSPNAALNLMGQGGIPVSPVIQGGVIKYAQLEHIWVEAWVDYNPSRGFSNKSGDTWVSMDASFKRHDYSQGMDIKSSVPFDTQGMLDQIAQTAQINELDSSVTGIEQSVIQTILDDYRTQVKTYIEQIKPNASLDDVLGSRKISVRDYQILFSGLPYQLLQTADSFAALPDHLRYQIQFDFYASYMDQMQANIAFSYQTSLAKLSNQRVSFMYEPETEADEAVIDDAYTNYQAQFPAYLVNMTPSLKVGGQLVAGSGSYPVGTNQILKVTIQAPWYRQSKNYNFVSGDVGVIGVNTAGVSLELYKKRTQAHDLSNTEYSDYTAEMYHQLLLGYWVELQGFKDIIAKVDDISFNQLPSHGFAGSPVSVLYTFGIPRWASYKSRVLDIKGIHTSAVHNQNKVGKKRDFMLKAGMLSSYLESAIFDQAFLLKPGYSMSAVAAIQKANEQGIPIYQLTENNIGAVLPKLTVDTYIKDHVRNAVNAGLDVMIPQDNITIADFTGVGYIITDPQTGSGSYLINGYRDGGDSPTIETVRPTVQISSPIDDFIMNSISSTGVLNLEKESGIVMGVSIPAAEAGAAGGGVIGALIVLSMLVHAFMEEVDKHYPESDEPTIYRKYAKTWRNFDNLLSMSFRAADNPDFTFGKGVVYLAMHDKDDETLREKFLEGESVACPPTESQRKELAVAYQLPNPKSDALPEMAASYIDIKITRDNLVELDTKDGTTNENGVTEIRVKSPLYWNPRDGHGYLHFGPAVLGIDFYQICIF